MKEEQKCVISEKPKHLIFNFLREQNVKKNVSFPNKKTKVFIIFYVIKEYTILINKTLFWNGFLRLKKKVLVYCILFSETPLSCKYQNYVCSISPDGDHFNETHTLLVCQMYILMFIYIVSLHISYFHF